MVRRPWVTKIYCGNTAATTVAQCGFCCKPYAAPRLQARWAMMRGTSVRTLGEYEPLHKTPQTFLALASFAIASFCAVLIGWQALIFI